MKYLFTNVPLVKTIDITLKRIYEKHETTTSIGHKEMIDLITLLTKNVPFTFNYDIEQQRNGIRRGSPLRSVLAGIIIAELKKPIIPKLNIHLCLWKCCADYTLTIVNVE